MPIEIVHRYTRAEIRANPDKLYVFGDNRYRMGYGGQASAARGEPNAVGIVTKHWPAMTPAAFFVDADMGKIEKLLSRAFGRLEDHLSSGGTVVLPADGVGTGLAKLPEKAPKIAAYIDERMTNLKAMA